MPAEGPVWIHCAELMAPCALLFSTIEEIEVYRWTDGVEPEFDLELCPSWRATSPQQLAETIS